ncbi:MAG TPA: type VI secretion system baseplate subunit TssF [Planctomycetaceae bacterium]|nr:type VI secretion system baseplate subunit TssF [Planctomycetaceae bacterium]|tara:strand:+ start:29538 stop:31379 length:1842 start_codon:yes stop_codon:yes gene_type:complete
MTDELLLHYNRELAYLRHMGAEFAQAHPKIASRLRLSENLTEDPHVARLIEAFAYLNARTRHKIEDEFPEIAQGLVEVLYPHYLAPLPAAAIVQLQLDQSQSQLTSGYHVARRTEIETEPIAGIPCRFQTCYPVELWPVSVTQATYQGHPFTAPTPPFRADVRAVVRIQLQTRSDKVDFSQLGMESLRFFLRGTSTFTHQLYESLLNNTVGVGMAAGADASEVRWLAAERLRPVGFDPDQGLIDYPARSFPGYRLLREFFTFPDKFLFIDIEQLGPTLAEGSLRGNQMELYLYLNQHIQDLEQSVSAETFALGCCPIVNLYRQRAEPLNWDHSQSELRIVPDARRPLAHEIHTVQRVIATSPDNEETEFLPFYSIQHATSADKQPAYWHATRRPARNIDGQSDHGTEVFLSLVDLSCQPAQLPHWTVDVETTCLNRDLPGRLPFGGQQPLLQLASGGVPLQITCLTPPTRTLRTSLGHETLWRVISHLSLNHLSLVDSSDGGNALREILRLYVQDSSENEAMIEGLTGVRSQRVVGRVGGSVNAGFCRGTEVTLELDEDKFSGGGMFLFASVLERFLALYTNLNSFTSTVLTTPQRESPLKRWPPRAGHTPLV